MWILFAILLAAVIALLFSAGTLLTLIRTGIPAVPSSPKRIKWLLDHYFLPQDGAIVDLGCGDGRLLIEVKKRRPNIRCIGYELNPWDMIRARWNARWAKVEIELFQFDFFKADLSGATIVYCYLLDSLLPRVAEKLEKELKPGAIVIAHAFPFPNWVPSSKLVNSEDPMGTFYVYTR